MAKDSISWWLENFLLNFEAHFDEEMIILIGPGVREKHLRGLATIPHYLIWDMRLAWDDLSIWHAFSKVLAEIGFEREKSIEPRFSLAPKNLKYNTIASYNEIAEEFTDQWFDHPPVCAIEEFLQKLRPNSRVLDAGCGPGHHAQFISNAGHDVVGIDLSDAMLEQARKRVSPVHLIKMDVQAITFPAKTFDAIWCAAVILHIPREQIRSVLLNFKRILKPGGILGLNLQVGRPSELVQFEKDNRFFEYYSNANEVARFLEMDNFEVEAIENDETGRNTHNLDITLKWSTLYARELSDRQLDDRLKPIFGIENGFA